MGLIRCIALIAILIVPVLGNADSHLLSLGKRVAQFEGGDDAYDPFADYSEFEEGSEEEADVNFFRHGRFFTLGLAAGQRRFSGVLPDIYAPGTTFGGFLSYFFDLRFALQIGYLTDDHSLTLKTPTKDFTGKITLSSTSFHLKYFMNTQNVTRGIAALNPYFIGGISQVYRTSQIAGASTFGRDGAMSFDGGVGLEIPMMRNKMFFGAQFLYNMVNFADESTEITFQDDTGTTIRTGIYPKGDAMALTAILGINF